MYHNTDDLRGEPHTVAIRGEDDVHVTEEVFKRPLFLQPTYRYLELMSSLARQLLPQFPHLHIRPVLGKEGLSCYSGSLPGSWASLLADTTVSLYQSKGPPWKPSLMPLSVSSG